MFKHLKFAMPWDKTVFVTDPNAKTDTVSKITTTDRFKARKPDLNNYPLKRKL